MEALFKKLHFKSPGMVIQAPEDLLLDFVAQGCQTAFGPSPYTLVFVLNKDELLKFLHAELKHIVPDSVFWIAYPKGTSKLKSNINRDSIRMIVDDFGLSTVSAISIDDTWSALRFRHQKN